MRIVFLGPQGSGKGTQAEMISKKIKVPHISTGDIFREIENDTSSLGRRVKSLIDKGSMVPDNITNKIVAKRISKNDAKKGFILDGYPRDLSQAKFLSKISKIDACILVDISDQESTRRIAARRICPECHENYNTLFLKSKKPGVCDKCGSKLRMREDDKPAFVRKRLMKYHEQTVPLIRFYTEVLIKVNGARPISVVSKDIVKKIKALR